jgi:hypothetical protein
VKGKSAERIAEMEINKKARKRKHFVWAERRLSYFEGSI